MRNVLAGQAPIGVTVKGIEVREVVDGFGPGVIGEDGITAGEALFEVELQRVEAGVGAGVGAADAAEVGINAALLRIADSGAGPENGRILVEGDLLIATLITEVGDAANPFRAELAFEASGLKLIAMWPGSILRPAKRGGANFH